MWLANDQNISRADAARRGAWQLRADLLIEKAGRALGSRFGGIWIDEADHGRIKVGAVGAKAADQEWLDAQGFRGAADIVDVPRSLSDLEAAVDWLWSRAAATNQEAVDRGASWTLAVSITPSRSTANLYVPPAAHRSEQQRAFIEEAQTRLGSALHVEEYETPPHEGACTFSLPPHCDPTPSCRHRHRLPGRLHRRVSCAQPQRQQAVPAHRRALHPQPRERR